MQAIDIIEIVESAVWNMTQFLCIISDTLHHATKIPKFIVLHFDFKRVLLHQT